jgi:hypothetical protein
MSYKISGLLFFSLFFSAVGFGQLEKTLHQTFDLGEKTTLLLDLYGEYAIVPWAGNNILVETNVQLYNSTSSVLKHFIEKDLRYQIDVDTMQSGALVLVSHDKKRIGLRTKTGAVSTEVITTKVFVPEDFIVKDEKTLVKEAEKN